MQDHIYIKGARENNLKNIDVTIPRDKLVVLTGLSGSGKSSLVNEIIYKRLGAELNRMKTHPGKHTAMEGLEYLDKVVGIDQSPIGRTPRSNPATYTNLFNAISLPPRRRPRPVATGRGASPLTPVAAGARPAPATAC